MKTIKVLFFIALCLGIIACQTGTEKAAPEENYLETPKEPIKDGYFIHISSGYNAPAKALMGLSFANKVMDEYDVVVFFDLEAVKLLERDAADIQLDNFESLKVLMTFIYDMGVDMMACPMCLKRAGIDENNLADGVKPAEKDKFFGFTKGRIISLNY